MVYHHGHHCPLGPIEWSLKIEGKSIIYHHISLIDHQKSGGYHQKSGGF
jgi:hypothetical protein